MVMINAMAVIRRYRAFLILVGVTAGLVAFAPSVGQRALALSKANVVEMLSFLPPIFLLLGLLDAWVDRKTMMAYMGDEAGLRGTLLAFVLGSAAAGPLYAAFPMAGVMMEKGASMRNVFVFIGTWSTTKIPLIMFETATLGFRFMAMRLVFNIAGIFIIAKILEKDLEKHPMPPRTGAS
ncbi:permease [Mailhella sp.]|uniref:permease n=1 Tax=Mailhella sp. TaxID=1981029 RepID=UPI003AB83220